MYGHSQYEQNIMQLMHKNTMRYMQSCTPRACMVMRGTSCNQCDHYNYMLSIEIDIISCQHNIVHLFTVYKDYMVPAF